MKSVRDPIDVAIGAELRKRREAARMTLTDVGKALGVTYQQIQKYETGTNRVAFATGVRFAKLFNCDIDELTAGALDALGKDERATPKPPSVRALKLAGLVDSLPPAQRDAIDRIVEAIVTSAANRAELAAVARDGHPALSYAH